MVSFVWLSVSLALLAVLYLFIRANAKTSWAQREIYGTETRILPNLAIALFSLMLGYFSYSWGGLFFGVASSVVIFLFIHSALTDWVSTKAPRELSTFSWTITLVALLANYFIYSNSQEDTRLLYALLGVGTWALMWITLKIVAPSGIGMADIRILGIVALFSFWLSPIYLLLTVLVASPIQLISRKLYSRSSKQIEITSKYAPYIPALVISSIISAPLAVLVGV